MCEKKIKIRRKNEQHTNKKMCQLGIKKLKVNKSENLIMHPTQKRNKKLGIISEKFVAILSSFR